MDTTATAVTVYTRTGCVMCGATFRALAKAGIEYQAIDTTGNTDLEKELRASGALQMPVVVSPIGTWDGYRDDRIRDLRDHLTGQLTA